MNKAFTLIELLVVVLIIGILSAIALTQYQTTVDKTKYIQIMTITKAIKDAQEIYYLANGHYSTDFDELDIVMPDGYTTKQANEIHYPDNTWYNLNGKEFTGYDSNTGLRIIYNSHYRPEQGFTYGSADDIYVMGLPMGCGNNVFADHLEGCL